MRSSVKMGNSSKFDTIGGKLTDIFPLKMVTGFSLEIVLMTGYIKGTKRNSLPLGATSTLYGIPLYPICEE